jgi:sucrose-6-phosphate hydrolase SacC (GH32 family)
MYTPDLIDLLSGFKNGLEYSMVTSPYVSGDARYENPSVMFSNDLRNWVAGGLANPLIQPPDGACSSRDPANCDNCFAFNSVVGRFYVYCIGIAKDKKRTLVRLASDDCIHWSSTEVLGDMDVFSPSIIYEVEENSFYMWASKDYQMNLYKSQDGRKWEFMAKCNMQQSYGGKNFQVWHLTVLKVEKEYWAFVVMNPAGALQGQPPTHIFLL